MVDKIWDLEYAGTCCLEGCYRRRPHVCAWLHDSEIKVRPQKDPIGIKRKMEDFDDDNDDARQQKKLKKEIDNKAKPRRRLRLGV